MTFASTAFSRTRSEIAALVRPRPVHENAAMRITTARPGIDPAGRVTPRMMQPAANEKAETKAALPITGSARPTKSGKRLAGLTRIALSVFWLRSPLTVCDIANRHGIAAYWIAFPVT